MKIPLYPADPILLVDDEKAYLHSLRILLQQGEITNTVCCSDSREVMPIVDNNQFSLILLDLTMPFISGYDLLSQLAESHPEIPVIILTGHDHVDAAVNCIKTGALDYCVKNDEGARLIARIKQSLANQQLSREYRNFKSQLFEQDLHRPDIFSEIITQSERIYNIFRYIEATRRSPEPFLITGESGVGKELVAQAVHKISRPSEPWVAVNVAGLDDVVFSDTLFGHVKGAYTGADSSRAGMLEKAGEGTLFLDEIGDLSQTSQIKLLRLIQEGEYFPLGSDTPKRNRSRFLFSTNVDLQEQINKGRFRKDLFYRLQTHQIDVPPLGKRKEDLPLLVQHFIDQAASKWSKRPPLPAPDLLELLEGYSFPGNVRELRALIFDAVSVHRKGPLSANSIRQKIAPASISQTPSPTVPPSAPDDKRIYFPAELPTLKESAEQLIEEALQRSNGNLNEAAQMLGITRQALGQRLKKRSGSKDE